ncbi:hypothetical protein DNTS_020227 [Danionella cerebrum]|uniref:Uncharacterized protein n=1 Tax=Danionella cerebrum TaxID=2873325 RepID=A0A553RCN5_9TELE|nr:hypothetical protein DNTS_020227 [Danionella translucida]
MNRNVEDRTSSAVFKCLLSGKHIREGTKQRMMQDCGDLVQNTWSSSQSHLTRAPRPNQGALLLCKMALSPPLHFNKPL